ncbi:Ig-like domain-containing protein, partial [Flavobacterium frigoris]
MNKITLKTPKFGKILFFVLSLLFSLNSYSQFYDKHYIAPAPWQYLSNANVIVIATESTTAVNVTIAKSDGTFVANGSAIAGAPLVYRFTGVPSSFPMHPMNSVINGGGLIITGDKPISVNVRNIASDNSTVGDSFIKGNASLTSFGNPGIGVSFRIGYYRNDSTGNGTPIYSAMALYNNTVVSLNGTVVATLQAGQSWLFKTTLGALITSSKGIVMNTGAAIDAPSGCGDGTFDQIPPISVLGKEYIIVKGNGNDKAEQTTVVATVANTSVQIDTYTSTGAFSSTVTKLLTNAGDFYTFINGVVGNNKYSSSRIVATKNVVVYSGTADGCEVDISTVAPAQVCSGSLVVETTQFLGYTNQILPYFGYVLLNSATDKVYLNGIDIQTLGGGAITRKQLGTTGWYLITFTDTNISSPVVVKLSSASRLSVSFVEQGGGFSMSGFFSKFVDQPTEPNLAYVAGGSCAAQSAILTVNSGIAPYQWFLNGTAIAGAISSSYTATTSGSYSVSSTTVCGPSILSNSIPVALCTDLSITKSVDNMRPIFGNNVTFTITATNNGPNTGTGVIVSDVLPSGYTFVSATPSIGTYSNGTGVWAIGNLSNGASAALTVVATVKNTGVYINTASVSSDETDATPANNTASITPTPISCASAPTTTGATICPGGSGSLTGTTANLTTLSGAWTAGSPSSNRPKNNIKSTDGCGFDNKTRNYVAIDFQVSVAGIYVFTMADNANYDGMGYIVSGAYSPGTCPGTGVWLNGDDDSNGGTDGSSEPKITTSSLAVGTTYTLISTTNGNNATTNDTFNWSITPPAGGEIIPTINWYTVASGGSPIGSGSPFNPVGVSGSGLADTNISGTTTYYAASSDKLDCRTTTPFVINKNSVAPTGIAGSTTICPGDFTTLTVSGGTLGTGAIAEWFSGSCGTTAVGTGNSITVSPLANTTYYVRYKGTCNTTTCFSVPVLVNTTAPPAASAQSFCSIDSKKVSDLVATGTTVKWYDAATAGTLYTGSETLVTGTYYASQTLNGCESLRTSVGVTVNATPSAPSASAQTFCTVDAKKVSDLVATGTAIKWYSAATSGTLYTGSETLVTETYYASQTT